MKHTMSLTIRMVAIYLALMCFTFSAGAVSVEEFQAITCGRTGNVPSEMVMIDEELMMRIPKDWEQIEYPDMDMCFINQEEDAVNMIAVASGDEGESTYAEMMGVVEEVSDVRCRAEKNGIEWFAGNTEPGIILICQGRNGKNYAIFFLHQSMTGEISENTLNAFGMAIHSLRRTQEEDFMLSSSDLQENNGRWQEPAVFEDTQFEAMLRQAMCRGKDEPIYMHELRSIQRLYIMDGGMDLYDWQNLRDFSYEQQAVLSLADLKKFENLKTLYVCDMQVTGLECLESFTQLDSLSLIGCGIDSCEPFKNLMSLSNLSLARNDVEEIGALNGLVHLEYLNLFMNPVSDIGVVSGMTDLKGLLISGTCVTSLEPLRGCEKLEWINASEIAGQTLSLEPLGGLTQLEDVEFKHTATSDREHIAHVKNVQLSNAW